MSFALVAFAIAAMLSTSHSNAQNQMQGQGGGAPGGAMQGPGGGARPQDQGPPQTMDLASAKKMVAAAEAAAAAKNQHIAICVMDSNGDVVLSERMDGTPHIPTVTAQGKARAVILFGMATGQIADAIQNKKPIEASVKAPAVGSGGGEITVMRGGLPIMKYGKIVGAIAVGGSASEQDEAFSQAGIDALK
jgi:glc operon protein GlcG